MIGRFKNYFGMGRASAPNFELPKGERPRTMQEPQKLPHAEAPVGDYPVDRLSPGLRTVVEAIVSLTQGPAAIAAQSVLAAVSLSFASRAKVETLGSSANVPCFFVLIALSGERKSAADKHAMAGITKTILELRTDHAAAIAEHSEAVAGLARGEDKPPRPVCPNFLLTEPTIEGAFKAIESRVGFLGWFTDEASSFWGGHSMSKEKRALTCGLLSKFWDGAFFVRPRATQEGDGYVPPTPMTVNLMFQPIMSNRAIEAACLPAGFRFKTRA